jgi:pyridoxine 5-phosphate synthase
MVSLSVNVNKIATLRNSRGGSIPSVLDAVDICLDAGAQGITVHPRADERHIRRQDVLDIAARLVERHAQGRTAAELNIEGDPRSDLVDLVEHVRPTQCTLVPVVPGEITSQAGWSPGTPVGRVGPVVDRLRRAGVRVSVFVDPDPSAIRWVAGLGADRIELYTEPFARVFATADERRRLDAYAGYCDAAVLANELGLGVNAGHDLDLENLRLFRGLPHLDEVSIGHALISRSLWVGLDRVVQEYLAVLRATS